MEVLQRHGIPVNAKNDDIRLAATWKLEGTPKRSGQWLVDSKEYKVQRDRGNQTCYNIYILKLY